MTPRDTLFAETEHPREFVFDAQVAEVFDDMLKRSIPQYEELQRQVTELVQLFARDGSAIYDLGCSTGTTLALLDQALGVRSIRLIGLDYAPAMLDQARDKLTEASDRIELRQQDINADCEFPEASVVLLNWTLQFVRPLNRDRLIAKIHADLMPGGCLILLEKVLVGDPLLDRLYIELYHQFKLRNGYSPEEISRKREALENVLIPYRVEENLNLLRCCGFDSADVFFRWYNFAGLIAIKTAEPQPR